MQCAGLSKARVMRPLVYNAGHRFWDVSPVRLHIHTQMVCTDVHCGYCDVIMH